MAVLLKRIPLLWLKIYLVNERCDLSSMHLRVQLINDSSMDREPRSDTLGLFNQSVEQSQ